MSALFAVLATGVVVAGAVLAYLAWPHQRLARAAAPARPALAGAAGCLALSVVLYRQALGPAAAVYCALLVAMLALTALPFLAALRRPPAETR